MIALLPVLALLAFPAALDTDDSVTIGDDVVYLGAEVDEEVAPGGTQELALYFQANQALADDVHIFVHIESAESECRIVRDVQPTVGEGGAIEQRFELTVPEIEACGPQRLEVFTGLYQRGAGRLPLVDLATVDDRIHAAYFHIVSGAASSDRATIAPSAMARQRVISLLRPWRYWLLGLLLSIALTVFLRRRRRPEDDEADEALADDDEALDDDGDGDAKADHDREAKSDGDHDGQRWWWPEGRPARLVALGPMVTAIGVLIASIYIALDFVKDDAYITFRYAQNLVNGRGLVFNVGERVEGSTTFLWTFVIAPFEAMGLDLFQVTEILGTALCIGTLFAMASVFVHSYGVQKNLAHSWPALWLATSSTATLWATSGMEGSLGMLLPVLAIWMTFTALERKSERLAAGAGVVMALGCLTRPEIHLIGAITGLYLIGRAIKAKKLDPLTAYWFAGLLGLTAPAHLFRYAYFGGLMPNTYYVKTSRSTLVFVAGLHKLHDMFSFNGLGAIVMLAPLAFADRQRRALKAVMAVSVVGFMAYIVKVGADEMRWHRLYLPALPLLLVLGMMGLRNLVVAVGEAFRDRPKVAPGAVALASVLVIVAMSVNLSFTYASTGGFNGRGELSGTYHPDMGKFLTRHERAGALVAFQDMGSTPYHAPDLSFLDFFGLVDHTVARARHEYGLHPFAATEAFRNQPAFDADMRTYFHERNPEWAILTSYIHGSQMAQVSERFARDPTPRALGHAVSANPYQFRIYDERFRERYVHVRTWPRSASYYLSMFRRRDLFAQTPGEVVLDAPPEGLSGVTATFDHGLQLIGSEVQPTAREKHEFFVTTWWQPTGPADADTHFFLHVESADARIPYDHIPGDWMYPADRWQAGDILENRVLVQVPVGVPPGEYIVHLGIYNPSSGQRWPIVEGDDVGDSRVVLGTVTIESQRSLLDHIILPTRLDEQRVHGDRIIEHGRQPGE